MAPLCVYMVLMLWGCAAIEGYITHNVVSSKKMRLQTTVIAATKATPEPVESLPSWISNLLLMLPGRQEAKSKSNLCPVQKKSLLKAISATRSRKALVSGGEGLMNDRLTILQAVEALESEYMVRSPPGNNPNTCAGGEWSLIYSTKQPSSTSLLSPSVVDVVSGQLYKIFFKFAPFLAGGQEDSRGLVQQVSNKQLIDLVNGKVLNTVTLKSLPILNKPATIKVCGEVEEVLDQGGITVPGLLTVIFTEFSFIIGDDGRPVQLPLPRPRGSLRTTFCDSDLRVSRGGQGGVFVVKRMG